MTIEGKISQILPLEEGTSVRGLWKKQLFVIDIAGPYQNQVCFSLWGEKIDEIKLTLGAEVEVHYNLSSREYNGRWYTEAKAYKMVENAQKVETELGAIAPDEFEDDEVLPF